MLCPRRLWASAGWAGARSRRFASAPADFGAQALRSAFLEGGGGSEEDRAALAARVIGACPPPPVFITLYAY